MTLRTVEIRIEGRPPTPNNRPERMGYVQRLKREWRAKAKEAAERAMGDAFGRPMRQADIEVVFLVPDRARRDRENLIASLKWLTDGIVEAGVIADDSEDVINEWRFPRARYVRGETASVYRITELDAGPELGL